MEREGEILQKGQNWQTGSCRKSQQEVYTDIGGHSKELVNMFKETKKLRQLLNSGEKNI